jgi:hypothetical protein
MKVPLDLVYQFDKGSVRFQGKDVTRIAKGGTTRLQGTSMGIPRMPNSPTKRKPRDAEAVMERATEMENSMRLPFKVLFAPISQRERPFRSRIMEAHMYNIAVKPKRNNPINNLFPHIDIIPAKVVFPGKDNGVFLRSR